MKKTYSVIIASACAVCAAAGAAAAYVLFLYRDIRKEKSKNEEIKVTLHSFFEKNFSAKKFHTEKNHKNNKTETEIEKDECNNIFSDENLHKFETSSMPSGESLMKCEMSSVQKDENVHECEESNENSAVCQVNSDETILSEQTDINAEISVSDKKASPKRKRGKNIKTSKVGPENETSAKTASDGSDE